MATTATGIVPTLTTGQRLTIAMEHAGMKPESMAVEMRCSATTIRNYLSGRTRIDYAHMRVWSEITGWSWWGRRCCRAGLLRSSSAAGRGTVAREGRNRTEIGTVVPFA